MKFSLFSPVTVGPADRLGTGLLGLEPQLYGAAVARLREQAVAADESGWTSLMLAEQHFEVEGFQVTPNPLLLNVHLAQYTRRLRHGQMGLVLPAWNPLRLAEDIAVADHLTGGRLDVGLTRGYRTRSTDVLGRPYGVGAAGTDDAAADRRNRDVFEEWFEIMLLAWTENLFAYDGNFLKFPPPETAWTPPTSGLLRAGVRDGVMSAVGIAPKPLQTPHPPLYTTVLDDPETVTWAARVGSALITTATQPHRVREVTETYTRAASAFGADAHGVALCRLLSVAPTYEQALRTAERAMPFVRDRLGALGLFEPLSPQDAASYNLHQLIASGVLLLGTPDGVGEQVAALTEAYGVGHLVLVVCADAADQDGVLQTITQFGTRVIPRLITREGRTDAGAGE
ncbi:LLM class flavin-dependent oxidoreductase [Actinocorallia sp. A-T 12471]|uniref:LLM class flavin-dependent oxidoreductase n=1 Tax=Actinocorallia sp. A-T 12471 TaxID=3089813 RepID=UPI0029D17E06|nr:LLM class flavin-dependent oxidoreductase [Actinocorallia sp. A-T 12471]MDX6742009.1 LLM class flavin-dependent oxidoreductase [Actinocorallia sp. A-T 12471]